MAADKPALREAVMTFLDRSCRSGPVAAAPVLAAHTGPVAFLAPLKGRIVPLELVPDPVFSARMPGDGFAIAPGTNDLPAPSPAPWPALPKARHAITLTEDNGAESYGLRRRKFPSLHRTGA